LGLSSLAVATQRILVRTVVRVVRCVNLPFGTGQTLPYWPPDANSDKIKKYVVPYEDGDMEELLEFVNAFA
jgi:hypothetical protein